jgi:hypothetical protein
MDGPKHYNIRWQSAGIDSIRIELSTDSGQTYSTIKQSVNASLDSFNWTVPNHDYPYAQIKIVDPVSGTNALSGLFRINAVEGIGYLRDDIGAVNVFPNPNNGSFYVEFATHAKMQSVCIYNLMGELIQRFDSVDDRLQINIPSSGLYLLKVDSGDKSATKRIVVY